MAEPRRKQAARQLRPEYLSAIARERERISALQTGDRSRLPLDSPRLRVSLPRVRFLEGDEGETPR